jgi:hypothetical protein
MKITRDVIIDMLPLYLADEASDDTKALVEQFLKQDPTLAQQIQDQSIPALTEEMPIPLTQEVEMRALTQTKNVLRWRSWFMAGAIFFTLLPFSVKGGEDGVHWLFADSPKTIVAMAIAALVLWIGYFANRYRLRETGF